MHLTSKANENLAKEADRGVLVDYASAKNEVLETMHKGSDDREE